MTTDKPGIGIIGLGNMGSAIAERLKGRCCLWVFDKDKEKTKNLRDIKVADTAVDLIKQTDTVILAVKPQDFAVLLDEIKDNLKNKLVVSIAAGITTRHLEGILGKSKIIRVMPNICAKIGEAESVLCKGRHSQDRELDFVRQLFDCLGRTWMLPEEMFNAATAIVGSGPAYIYYDMESNNYDPRRLPELAKQSYIERLSRAAKKVGFDGQTALDLGTGITTSSISLSVVSGIPPAELRRQITSRAGTTEAAIKILMQGGSWEEAAQAAARRAEELSRR